MIEYLYDASESEKNGRIRWALFMYNITHVRKHDI